MDPEIELMSNSEPHTLILPPLPDSGASVKEWQRYVTENSHARGWSRAADLEIFLLFSEEVGEFAKAFRRFRRLFTERVTEDRAADLGAVEDQGARQELAEEAADVLSYLLDLCSRLDIDLEQALLAKEKKNRTREWESLG